MSDKKECLPLLDIEKVTAILGKIAIFAGLSDKRLYALFRLLEQVCYKKGEVVFERGDEPGYIYIVRSGRIKLIVREEEGPLELALMEEGQCLGESSVIGILKHDVTAIAEEDSELIVLSRRALLSIYTSDLEMFSTLIMNIAREVCRRLHATDEVLLHYVLRK